LFEIFNFSFFIALAILVGFISWKNLSKKNNFYIAYLWFGGALIAYLGSKIFFIINNFSAYKASIYNWQNSGSVFYGGLICGLIWLFINLKKNPDYKTFLNTFTPSICFAHSIGRIGCFVNSCCFGKICKINGFSFRLPVQLIEASFLLILGIYLLISLKKNNDKLLSKYLFSYSVFRFFIEFLRGDQIRGSWGGYLSPSQYISLFIVIIGVFFLIKSRSKSIKSMYEN